MDVKTLCLGVLSLGDASGYEIKKRLQDKFFHFYTASFGSIYPALNQLELKGFVDCNRQTQKKRPDKKVYRLMPKGRLELVQKISNESGKDQIRSEFLVAMLFANLLPVRQVSGMIDQRIKQNRDYLIILNEQKSNGSVAERFVAGYARSVYSAALDFLENNRHLVESEALLAEVDDSRHETTPD